MTPMRSCSLGDAALDFHVRREPPASGTRPIDVHRPVRGDIVRSALAGLRRIASRMNAARRRGAAFGPAG